MLQQLKLDTPYVRGVAGYSPRECYGGILLWSVPAPQDGSNATAVSVTVRVDNVPFRTFTVQAFLIDDKHKPKVVAAQQTMLLNQRDAGAGNAIMPQELQSHIVSDRSRCKRVYDLEYVNERVNKSAWAVCGQIVQMKGRLRT